VRAKIFSFSAGRCLPHAEDQIATLLSQSTSIPSAKDLHDPLLRFLTASLAASQLPLWPTRSLATLDSAWSWSPTSDAPGTLSLELTGALAALDWPGWRAAALPGVLRRTPELLETNPSKTLELLVALARAGKLNKVDAVWKQKVGKWVEGRLESWETTEERVRLISHH
jgi:U3 small nucleolar RNA-associated protein 20